MLEIDIRSWDHDLVKRLMNIALAGGAALRVDDNLRIVVLDEHLWDTLQQRLPDLSDILNDIQALKGDD